jgi:hypothetical protein
MCHLRTRKHLRVSVVVVNYAAADKGYYIQAPTEAARWSNVAIVDIAEEVVEIADTAVIVDTLEIVHKVAGHILVAESVVDTFAGLVVGDIVIVVVVAAMVADANLPDLWDRGRETRTTGGESSRGPESDFLAALRRFTVYQRCEIRRGGVLECDVLMVFCFRELVASFHGTHPSRPAKQAVAGVARRWSS